MKQFGKLPPRSLDSFGVAGVLAEDCRVFYNSLFNTKNLGRVTDLLSARLSKANPDELRLRSVIVTSVFEAFRAQIEEVLARKRAAAEKAAKEAAAKGKVYEPKDDEDRLDEPIVVECGIDGEKIAVGIGFTFPEGMEVETAGLPDRVARGELKSSFEQLIAQLYNASHRLVIRSQPSTRRFEMVSLLGLEGQFSETDLATREPIEVVIVPPKAADPPKVGGYEELGDLDYESLLATDTRLTGTKKKSTGQALVNKMTELADGDARVTAGRGEGEEETKLSGDELDLNAGSDKVAGRKGLNGGDRKVSGDKSRTENSSVTFGADEKSQGKESSVKFKGGQKKGEDGEDVEIGEDETEISVGKKKKVKGVVKKADGTIAEIESDDIEEDETKITFKAGKEGEGVDDESEEIRFGKGGEGKKKRKYRMSKSASEGQDEADLEEEDLEEIVIEGEKKKKEKEQKIRFKGEDAEETDSDEETVAIKRRVRINSKGEAEEEIVEEEVQERAPVAKRVRKFIRRLFGGEGEAEGDDGTEVDAAGNVVVKSDPKKKENEADRDYAIKGKAGEEEDDAGHNYTFKDKDGKELSADEKKKKESAQTKDSEPPEGQSETEKILKTFEEKAIDQTVDKVQKEALKLKEEIKDERTKRWVDNLTRDLLTEKASLRETAKRVSNSVRQKELEFKNKQSQMEEELRKREEALQQKTSALNRTREQLTQVTRSLERMKQLSQEAADAASFKQKYSLAQKVLQSTKDENQILQQKIDEMRMQVNNLQLNNKNKGPSVAEFSMLQAKYDRAFKQIEDLKRQNITLNTQANDRRQAAGGPQVEELKKKYDGAMRLSAVSRKENELLQGRLLKAQKEESKHKAEIQRLQEALKHAQMQAQMASKSQAPASTFGRPAQRPGSAQGGLSRSTQTAKPTAAGASPTQSSVPPKTNAGTGTGSDTSGSGNAA